MTGPDATPWVTFRADLRVSGRAWKTAPGLPLTTACLLVLQYGFCAASNDAAAEWLILPAATLGVLSAGFAGTQRIWYLRCFHEDRLEASELWPLTRAFLGRFLVLGLVTAVAGAPLMIAASVAAGHAGLVVACVGWWLVLDFALTFVAPALAYTTRSVRAALTLGLRMLRRTWPASKWYALVPGLAAAVLAWTRPRSVIGVVATTTLAITSGMLALWFKGAIAAFYLRYFPAVSVMGAAYQDAKAAASDPTPP